MFSRPARQSAPEILLAGYRQEISTGTLSKFLNTNYISKEIEPLLSD